MHCTQAAVIKKKDGSDNLDPMSRSVINRILCLVDGTGLQDFHYR